jgi:hypothetical protein
MPRLALAALLLFAAPLVAAPVPKALKKPTVPQMVGTTWTGTNGGTELGTFEYTFREGGQFTATRNGQPYSNGTWKQDGDTVEWEFNNRYAVYTLTFKEGGFEGAANNINGKSWGVTLVKKE